MTASPLSLDLTGAAVKPVPGYQAVVDVLRREIALGRMVPGDRLPAERTLAEQLGVARETLRQALRVLEGSGEVETRRGSRGGAVIREPVIDRELIRADLRSHREAILAHHAYRSVLEQAAARLAAEHHDPADLDAMQRAQDDIRQAATMPAARAADTAFHIAVATAGRNPYLLAAIEDARAEGFHAIDALPFDFVTATSLDAHQRILDAIRADDAAAAEAAMREHITTSAQEFDQLLR